MRAHRPRPPRPLPYHLSLWLGLAVCIAVATGARVPAAHAQGSARPETTLRHTAEREGSSGEEMELEEIGDEHLLQGDLFYYRDDLYRAIGEYELFLMNHPSDARREAVRMKIAWLYHRGARYPAAAHELRLLSREHQDEPLGWWATLYFGHTARSGERFGLSKRAYERVLEVCDRRDESTCTELRAFARIGIAQILARAHDFEAATEQLSEVPADSPLSHDARRIGRYVESLDIPTRSPALAGVLSIVPGLGHMYLGQWGVGALAAVWNGIFIFALVDSIVDRSYGQAALIGLIELIWYGGTIFGAVAGAHRFNRDARRIVADGLLEDLGALQDDTPWPSRFPVPSMSPLRLQLRLRF